MKGLDLSSGLCHAAVRPFRYAARPELNRDRTSLYVTGRKQS